jgi:hypothetical protein
MRTIDFTIKGTAPLMFSKEPIAYEDSEAKTSRKSKSDSPVEIAKRCLHTTKNGKGELAVIPAHSLLKAVFSVITVALGRSTRKSWVKIVQGALKIEPSMLVIDPQEWTLDVRRAGTKGGGTGALLYRPRFDVWQASGTALYEDDETYGLSGSQVRTLFDIAGRFDGLGSYRIGNRGPFGSFSVVNWNEEEKVG